MKKILNITIVLMTLAFTSALFAEIMEGIRIECKDSDGKKLCKPIKVGDPIDEGFCKVTNIIICTYEPIARVIGSTFNPTSYIVKNISIDIQ
jgi:hypothetical protein